MEQTVGVQELLSIVKKRIPLIVLFTILATTLSGIYSFYFVQPIYKASTQILVSQAASGALSSLAGLTFDADAKYIETYNVIMKSPYILDQVIEELELQTTPEELNGSISVVQGGKSQVVTVSVQNPDAAEAVLIANNIGSIFQREISKLMKIDNIHILSPAKLSQQVMPIKPKPFLNMAVAFVFGVVVSIGLAFILEFLDNTLKKEQDVEKFLDLPLLGSVANIKAGANHQGSVKRGRGEAVDV